MQQNYQTWLDRELEAVKASKETPRLLCHACCAPCASYVLEYLSHYFEITVLYYNPNIRPLSEYEKRASELVRLLTLADYPNQVDLTVCDYETKRFEDIAGPFWDEPERGIRCTGCFELRLSETARLAKSGTYDYFATTLTVSPHKDAALINEIGGNLASAHGVKYLFSDFKKRDGYKHSIKLSNQFALYRQTYCGCKPS